MNKISQVNKKITRKILATNKILGRIGSLMQPALSEGILATNLVLISTGKREQFVFKMQLEVLLLMQNVYLKADTQVGRPNKF